jgi:hypothetical protein
LTKSLFADATREFLVMNNHVFLEAFDVFESQGTAGTFERLVILVRSEVEGEMSEFAK